jgi:hypothetical protein
VPGGTCPAPAAPSGTGLLSGPQCAAGPRSAAWRLQLWAGSGKASATAARVCGAAVPFGEPSAGHPGTLAAGRPVHRNRGSGRLPCSRICDSDDDAGWSTDESHSKKLGCAVGAGHDGVRIWQFELALTQSVVGFPVLRGGDDDGGVRGTVDADDSLARSGVNSDGGLPGPIVLTAIRRVGVPSVVSAIGGE